MLFNTNQDVFNKTTCIRADINVRGQIRISTGITQRDSLSPLLLNIEMDEIINSINMIVPKEKPNVLQL